MRTTRFSGGGGSSRCAVQCSVAAIANAKMPINTVAAATNAIVRRRRFATARRERRPRDGPRLGGPSFLFGESDRFNSFRQRNGCLKSVGAGLDLRGWKSILGGQPIVDYLVSNSAPA